MRRQVQSAGAVLGAAAAVALLYGLACLLPAIRCGSGAAAAEWDFEWGRHSGLTLLLWGWGGNNAVPWSANLVLALGVFCLSAGCYRAALLDGVVAAALGLTTWWVRRGDTLLVGYYLWQASHLALAAAAARALARRRGAPTGVTPKAA
jgi:hypothetical protein